MNDSMTYTDSELEAVRQGLLEKAFKDHEAGKDLSENQIAWAAYEAIGTYFRRKGEVLSAMKALRAQLQRDEERLAAGTLSYIGINSIGVVQGNGPALDVKVAELQGASETVKALLVVMGVKKPTA